MQCKLFDLAAFGSEECVFVADGADLNGTRLLRKSVKLCSFIDMTNVRSVYKQWSESRHDQLLTDCLLNCAPPWKNTFVYGGVFELENGVVELGVQSSLVDECEVESFKKERLLKHKDDSFDGVVILGVWQKELQRQAVTCMPHIMLTKDWRYVGVLDSRDNSIRKERYGTFYTLAPFVFQLMHCRNIVTQEHEPYRPLMPRGLRNKSPKIKYHTLAISDTLIKRDGHEVTGAQPGVSKHICRGNFAHYTEDKPLFGKYVGTFWRPMHIKGSAKHGIVGKDYTMQAID